MITVGMSPQVYRQVQAHDHAAWELVLNLQGSGNTVIGDQCYDFGPGSIICQPPNIPHTKFSQEGFRDVYIQLTSFPLARIAEENRPLIFQDDAEKSFETLLLMAHKAYHAKKNNHRLLVESLAEAVNQLLIGWQNRAPEAKDVDQLKNRLIESFSNPEMTTSQLLAEGPYCNDHLRRRFKKSTGQTPGEYLTNLRIEYAKKLMNENNMLRYSIAEICVMSGYYDSHYFSRIFKKKTGMTPAEYMKKASAGKEASGPA
ncbi:AraC family transcriptional regulator [Paenibacillus sp. YN15]|uniref:AraC family transcriptional regulator n=1 Tax=Paenibacillus sp. YN15 TaxID=1742774 RepID=UPI00215BB75D|nr:AraC family transcriptional regulator [Paenibacillus sp. YN15]